MTNTLCLFVFLLFSIPCLYGQDSQLCLDIKPSNAVVKINGEKHELAGKPSPFCLGVRPGRYEIQIWAPGFEIHTEEIAVEFRKDFNYAKSLNTPTPEYLEYSKLSKEYHRKKINRNVTAGVSLALNVATTAYLINVLNAEKGKDLKDGLDLIRENYRSAVGVNELMELSDLYDEALQDYNEEQDAQKTRLSIAIPAAVLSYGITAFTIHRQRKTKPIKPVFEVNNPWAVGQEWNQSNLSNFTIKAGALIKF